MITEKKGKNSKRPTDETIITDHSVITSSAKNNKRLMNDSNIFDTANKIVKNKINSETKDTQTLPLNREEIGKNSEQKFKIKSTSITKQAENNSAKIADNYLPNLPSVGQGNSELTHKSVHYQF